METADCYFVVPLALYGFIDYSLQVLEPLNIVRLLKMRGDPCPSPIIIGIAEERARDIVTMDLRFMFEQFFRLLLHFLPFGAQLHDSFHFFLLVDQFVQNERTPVFLLPNLGLDQVEGARL